MFDKQSIWFDGGKAIKVDRLKRNLNAVKIRKFPDIIDTYLPSNLLKQTAVASQGHLSQKSNWVACKNPCDVQINGH